MAKSGFYNLIKNKNFKKEAAKIKVDGQVHFIIYHQQKTQAQRDKMWIEALAAFKASIPVVFINDYASNEYIKHIRRTCKKMKFLSNAVHIAFTSGSTGKPKPVQNTDKMIGFVAKNHTKLMKLRSSYVFADFRNPDYIPGFTRFVVAQSLGARFIYINPALDYASIVQKINAEGVDFFSGSANYWVGICKVLEKNKIKLNIKVAHISGKVIPGVIETLKKYSRCKVYFTYATSETHLITIMDPEMIRKKPTSVGKPVPGIKVEIWDENGGKCKAFEEGEITVFNKFIAPPYFSPHKTGDIGYFDKEGVLYIVGRKDNRLTISGHRINVEQLEAAYNKYGVFMFGVPADSSSGNHDAVAVFETDESLAVLKDYVASVEPPINQFCFPRYVFKMKKFPRIDNGKIDAQKIKEKFQPEILEAKKTSVGAAPQKIGLEEKVLAIWRRLLNQKKIGAGDDFFSIGGSSLLALQLTGKISKEFGVLFPVVEIFRNPTPKKLIKRIRFYVKKRKKS